MKVITLEVNFLADNSVRCVEFRAEGIAFDLFNNTPSTIPNLTCLDDILDIHISAVGVTDGLRWALTIKTNGKDRSPMRGIIHHGFDSSNNSYPV